MKTDRLALDRATVRTSSVDGYLHIESSPVSKANVCPYYGAEIPNSEALGLLPNKVYQLLRDPVELAKAAPTFNNLPLLNQHIPVSAAAPPKEAIVGSTGTDAVFTPPYLCNSLVVWDAASIAGIETGEQKELSSSYRYVADMTPGEFEGVPYDGRMTQIVGNHVALVEAGRAGADVVVGDSLPTRLIPMKLSKKSVAMRAALGAYLRPLLAQDGAIPATRILVKRDSTPERIAADAKTVFAKQADIDVAKLAAVLKLAADEADESEMDDDKAEDEETEEEKKAREAKEAKDKAKDADPDKDGDEDGKKKAADEDDDADKDKDKADAKKANDAAITAAREGGKADALAEFKAIREAEEAVRPLVGTVVAMDSAEAVYRFALDSLGIDAKGIHASALPAMVKLAADRKPAKNTRVAMDSASADDFAKRFPTATKIARA